MIEGQQRSDKTHQYCEKLSKWTKTNILIINKRKRLLPLAKIIIVGKEFRS